MKKKFKNYCFSQTRLKKMLNKTQKRLNNNKMLNENSRVTKLNRLLEITFYYVAYYI